MIKEVKEVSELNEAKKIILASSKKVANSTTVGKTSQKEGKTIRKIYGYTFEICAEIKALKRVLSVDLKGEKNLSYNVIFNAYIKERLRRNLATYSNNSKKFVESSCRKNKGGFFKANLVGRFNRAIGNSIVTSLLVNSKQTFQFNLLANYEGIKRITKNNIEYSNSGQLDKNSLYNNEFTFVFSKTFKESKTKVATKLQLKKLEALKNPKKVNK